MWFRWKQLGASPSGTQPEEDPAEALPKLVSAAVDNTVVPVEHDESVDDRLIKGKTTFREVLDWGVPQETIEISHWSKHAKPAADSKGFLSGPGARI